MKNLYYFCKKTYQMKIFFFLTFSFFSVYCFSQDTAIFVSGDKLALMSYRQDSTDKNVFILKTMKGKYKVIHKEEIFSFVKKTGGEEIVFESFEADNANFTVENMRIYIQGEQAAWKNSKTGFATLSSFIMGAVSPVLLSSLGTNYLFYSPVPIAFTNFMVGLTIPTEKSVIRKYPQMGTNGFFAEGYRYTAKSKRLNNSIKSGLIGLGVGIISSLILANNTK